MKLISVIASCLAFTYGQDNTTDIPMSSTEDMGPTEYMMSTSTTMYTTKATESTEAIVYEQIPYDEADDPTDNLEDCDYFFMGTLDVDDISVYICGYEDEDEMGYTQIKLDIPANRWVIFGMSADGEVGDSDAFANYDGYNVGIPIDNVNYDILETFAMADKTLIELAPTIQVISDIINDNGRRILRLSRAETILESALETIIDSLNDTNITASDIVDYYYDFVDFSGCDDTSRLSVTYGPRDNARLETPETIEKFTAETYGNREAKVVTIDEQGGTLCGADGDDAPQQFINIFVAIIIGIVAMMF